ncbi:Hypothetical_protein [Hexamita inflata]|uniref:Hypothetical_protein n=1 Tax=Hexamita inflata TaxID=28002 RepID=A0AA86TME1_9EUKA|nr:Hypothetical protein HINF_LOCUS10619 [Hexamita inflata]CAI9941601.1 Hypothetical protein HINF_LOCUS29246 [Hexamita inflata]
MNTNADILLSQFGNILHVRPEQVAYQVMMLPDTQYHTRFAQLSLELNVDVNTLKQQFVEVAMTQLVNKQTRYLPEADSQESAGKKKVRQTYQRAIKQEYQQFQKLYAEKLFQVLRSADNTAVFTDDRELCSQVNEHLASHGQKTFWSSLQALVPSKTVKQLREYYQKSFLRVLYDSQIDVQDKELLREMIESQREASPTDIANQFLEVCAKELLQAQHRHVRHQPEEKVILQF